jgi:hypothetical protein
VNVPRCYVISTLHTLLNNYTEYPLVSKNILKQVEEDFFLKCIECRHAYGISFTDTKLNPIFSSYNYHTLYEHITTAAHFNKLCYHTPFRALDELHQCYCRLPDQHKVVPLCRIPYLNSALIQLLKVHLITWYESILREYK